MRAFVSTFLLPLVQGGKIHVGRPLGARAVERLKRVLGAVPPGTSTADDPIAMLATCRRAVAMRFLRGAPAPPLDETSLRLGAALHDLLALGHPALDGRGADRRQERIATAALGLATVPPPASEAEAVNRHSLLGRVPEIVRSDSTVHFWLGRQSFVGRAPPRRVTALPGLRRVRVEVTKRAWLREIGIPAVARPAFLALNVASPLGEALDPLRLEPPLAWSRILSVLRFPAIARVVAGQMIEIGIDKAGDALAAALLRFASFQEPPSGVPASAQAVAFALRFLAHVVWLDVLFASGRGPTVSTPRAAAAAAAAAGGALGIEAGVDLAVMMAAAERASPKLVWPPDLPEASDLGRAFRGRLVAMVERAQAQGMPRFAAAFGLAEFAVAPTTTPANPLLG
jgi:hypothetical protein